MKKLLDILRYSRGHGSKTEAKFINEWLIPELNKLGCNVDMDSVGNLWVETGTDPVLFVAHIDTCHRAEGMLRPLVSSDNKVTVNPKDVKNGATCLGADDAVGIYCNLKLIEAGVSGTYLFTRGEEKGGIGASVAAEDPRLDNFIMSVEVDRAGTNEIIVEQGGMISASKSFAKALASQLNMGHTPSDLGVYTDNYEFTTTIPENVNIAAGYERQHTVKEVLDLEYVDELVKKLVKVDWMSLPIERNPVLDIYPKYQYNSGNSPSNYWTLLQYCQDNPELVANYLESIGVDIYEIEEEAEATWEKQERDAWEDYDEKYYESQLRSGMY